MIPKTSIRRQILFIFLSSVTAEATPPPKKSDHEIRGKQSPQITEKVPPDSTRQLRELQKQLSSFEHLTVEFRQLTYRSLRKKTSVSTGVAYFSKPDLFRWTIRSPEQSEWIFDGKILSQVIPGSQGKPEILSYGKGGDKGKELLRIVDLVLNFDTLLREFRADTKFFSDHAEVSLTPLSARDKQNMLRNLLIIDLKNNYVRELKMEFNNGNHTTLQFTHPKRTAISHNIYRLPGSL
ncbi:MAG: outer membrane lipoprotein carrier protein LolA [Deltaproteobacteria bacterium]|nr:outer membrane lipoprotein carrier protein LolA [Deltaproteobacteria bacterium]